MKLFDESNLLYNVDKFKEDYSFFRNNCLSNFSGFDYAQKKLEPLDCCLCVSFLYYIEKKEEYAKKAYKLMSLFYRDEIKSEKGLSLYFELYYISLSYNFIKDSYYFSKYKNKFKSYIRRLSDYCFYHGGSSQNQDPASNWKALRFSMAGLGFLVSGDDKYSETKVYGCFQRCKRYLQNNMKDGFAGMEGDSYTRYAWKGLGPFGMALENLKKWTIRDSSEYNVGWQFMWDLATVIPIETSEGKKGISPDFVASNPLMEDYNFLCLAFYYIDEKNLPSFNKIFNMLVNDKKLINGSHFIYFLLNYKDILSTQEPLENQDWRRSLYDEKAHGYFGFRNKYENENDIVAQVYGKFSKTSGHKDICQCAFRIFGLNTLWAVGDSYEKRNQNIVYPGGYGGPEAEEVWRPMKNNGKLFSYDYLPSKEMEGYCITGVNAQTDFDVEKLKRRFLTKFNVADCEAVFVCGDTSLNARYWQMNTCPTNDVEILDDGYIIKDPFGNSLKATILYPTKEYEIKNGERERNYPYFIHNNNIMTNKFILIERLDEVPGMTEEMTIEQNRGMRNSLLYHRDENGKLWKPRYETHEGDFIVVMTLCNSEQNHPEVTMKGERILSGVDISIGDYDVYLGYDRVDM